MKRGDASRLWWSLPLLALGLVLAGAALDPAPAPATAAGPPRQMAENVEDLGKGCHVFLSGSNAGFIVTDDGVVAIDSLISPNHAKRVLAEIRKVTDKPVKFLVNTHWHADHTSGNDAFPDATVIYATKAARDRLEKDGPARWKQNVERAAADYEGHELVLPEETFTDEVTLELGGRKLLVKFLGLGHTDGDCVVVDREAKVIYAGDLLFEGMHPWMADGHSKDWIDTLQALEDLCTPEPETWRLVPGHGKPSPPTLAASMRDYLKVLRIEVQKAIDAGKTGDDLVAAVKMPERFQDLMASRLLEANVQRVASELAP